MRGVKGSLHEAFDNLQDAERYVEAHRDYHEGAKQKAARLAAQRRLSKGAAAGVTASTRAGSAGSHDNPTSRDMRAPSGSAGIGGHVADGGGRGSASSVPLDGSATSGDPRSTGPEGIRPALGHEGSENPAPVNNTTPFTTLEQPRLPQPHHAADRTTTAAPVYSLYSREYPPQPNSASPGKYQLVLVPHPPSTPPIDNDHNNGQILTASDCSHFNTLLHPATGTYYVIT